MMGLLGSLLPLPDVDDCDMQRGTWGRGAVDSTCQQNRARKTVRFYTPPSETAMAFHNTAQLQGNRRGIATALHTPKYSETRAFQVARPHYHAENPKAKALTGLRTLEKHKSPQW